MKLTAPQSFGVRWVAPMLPKFFRRYPDITVDLHLTDVHTDLISDGFDAALRIAAATIASGASSCMQFAALSSIDIYCHCMQKCRHPKRL